MMSRVAWQELMDTLEVPPAAIVRAIAMTVFALMMEAACNGKR
jgi:hypothetical protein